MSEKKQRAREVLESLLELMPPMLRNMIPVFIPQFQAQFDNVPDEDIDKLISHIRERLDYIEKGV